MIHSKLFSILFGTAAVALGAFVAGCALESGEPGGTSSESAALRAVDVPIKAPDVVGTVGQAKPVVLQPIQVAPVVHEDNLLGIGGADEGPRPHPWVPAPEDGTGSGSSDTTTNTGTTSDNKSSK